MLLYTCREKQVKMAVQDSLVDLAPLVPPVREVIPDLRDRMERKELPEIEEHLDHREILVTRETLDLLVWWALMGRTVHR